MQPRGGPSSNAPPEQPPSRDTHDTLLVGRPAGENTCDAPVSLVSGGIGITPPPSALDHITRARPAAHAARRLTARRVLVVVPTLDLLTQTARAWRRAGRSGAMIGVCSLRAEESQGLPCTTDPDELVAWVEGLQTVTVFATYASVGLRILQRAHAAGLGCGT